MASFDVHGPISEPDDPLYEARVLRAFIRRDRLVSIPARERKRRVILRFLLDQVLPDETPVAERDLNLRIARWNPDPAALRRYLVDAGLAERAAGIYRRAVPVRAPEGLGHVGGADAARRPAPAAAPSGRRDARSATGAS
jgi:hypothetical protein